MSAIPLDPQTNNTAIGLYITASGPITLDVDIGQLATWIKCSTAGTISWYNKYTDETGTWVLEAGEGWPIGFTKINSVGTTAGGLYWATSSNKVGNL